MSSKGNYIAVSGPIGVGKTVLAEALSSHLNAHFEKEVFEENPFLEKLYGPEGVARWGLACEMSFLPPRLAQLDAIDERIKSGEDVVADWTPYQNLVFSGVTLSDEDYSLYRRLFERLLGDFPRPDLVVLLDAPVPTLVNRIRGRGRQMERDISPAYLLQIQEGFSAWARETDVAVLNIDTRNLPIPTSKEVRDRVISRIASRLGMDPPGVRAPAGQVVCR